MTRLRIHDTIDEAQFERARQLPRAVYPIDHSKEPCGQCPAPCCAAIVRLTVVETLRLVFTLLLHPLEIVEPLADAGTGNSWPFKLDDPNLPAGRYQLKLRRNANGMCFGAFAPAQARVRCGIHDLRPGVCRVYPFTVTYGAHRFSVGGPKLCPIQWVQTEELRERLQVDVDRWLHDLDVDKQLVTRWNRGRRSDRSWPAFVTWLLQDAAIRLGHDPKRLEPPPRRGFKRRLW